MADPATAVNAMEPADLAVAFQDVLRGFQGQETHQLIDPEQLKTTLAVKVCCAVWRT